MSERNQDTTDIEGSPKLLSGSIMWNVETQAFARRQANSGWPGHAVRCLDLDTFEKQRPVVAVGVRVQHSQLSKEADNWQVPHHEKVE